MAKCKDCLHYEACLAFSKLINAAIDVEVGCEHFKDRTKYGEVIRCEKCKHYKQYTSYKSDQYCNWGKCLLISMDVDMPTTGFCCFGERKEDG